MYSVAGISVQDSISAAPWLPLTSLIYRHRVMEPKTEDKYNTNVQSLGERTELKVSDKAGVNC